MASTVTVMLVRSASGGIFRQERVSQRSPDFPSVGSCRLTMVEPKSELAAPGYCRLAFVIYQPEASNNVKHTSTLTCLPSLQARSARTSMPLVVCFNVCGADSTVG